MSTDGQTDYRFDISEHDGTITRARAYRLPSEWTTDEWRHYWDGVEVPAFIDEGYRGRRVLNGTNAEEDSERAIIAYDHERIGAPGGEGALGRLAVRLTEQTDQREPSARFICVGLDRGSDLYVLSWGGDPDNEWRDEIEALNYGDIWRIECEEYRPGFGMGGSDWVTTEEYPEQFYGEDKARSEFERIFPLDAFPAEKIISESV